MKAKVKTIDGGVAKDIELPDLFSEEYRPDLIKKAVMALQSTRRQPHGTYPFAGICSSAVGWGSGRGASHVPRLKNGSRAAKVPQATASHSRTSPWLGGWAARTQGSFHGQSLMAWPKPATTSRLGSKWSFNQSEGFV